MHCTALTLRFYGVKGWLQISNDFLCWWRTTIFKNLRNTALLLAISPIRLIDSLSLAHGSACSFFCCLALSLSCPSFLLSFFFSYFFPSELLQTFNPPSQKAVVPRRWTLNPIMVFRKQWETFRSFGAFPWKTVLQKWLVIKLGVGANCSISAFWLTLQTFFHMHSTTAILQLYLMSNQWNLV